MKTYVMILLLVMGVLSQIACEKSEGVGENLEEAGENIKESAEQVQKDMQ